MLRAEAVSNISELILAVKVRKSLRVVCYLWMLYWTDMKLI